MERGGKLKLCCSQQNILQSICVAIAAYNNDCNWTIRLVYILYVVFVSELVVWETNRRRTSIGELYSNLLFSFLPNRTFGPATRDPTQSWSTMALCVYTFEFGEIWMPFAYIPFSIICRFPHDHRISFNAIVWSFDSALSFKLKFMFQIKLA